MSRHSTGASPSANPARRSLLDTLNPFPRRPASSYSPNNSPLLHPDAATSTPTGRGFPRSTTPPSAQSHSHQEGSPELSGPAQRVSYSPPLLHPSLPYGGGSSSRPDSSAPSSRRSSFASDRPTKNDIKVRPMSLSVNYVPAKFTRMHTQGEGSGAVASSAGSMGMRRRRKVGGGREAFADNANRMGMAGMVDDDEGVEYKMARGGVRRKSGKKRALRWNKFKIVLFAANTVIMLYGLTTLVAAILVWLNVFAHADVIRVGNRDELIGTSAHVFALIEVLTDCTVSTVAAALCTLTAVFGYSGIILNNRAFLAVYTLLLWIDLGFIAAPGYMTYKQRTFNLEGKLNQQWSRYLGTEGRLRIQDALICCGYFSPFIEATQSPLCYSRSNLPGCKGHYLRLERNVLHVWYATAFGIVGAHILIIIAALLCSNHVTYRFGKGLTPKRYRLDLRSMGVILDDYANQIAAQFGSDVAQQALTRSVSRASGNNTPMAESLVDYAASRRSSFAPGNNNAAPSPNPGRPESHYVASTTSSTAYNPSSQYATYGSEALGGYTATEHGQGLGMGIGQPGVRLVSGSGDGQNQRDRDEQMGQRRGAPEEGTPDWYRDADEDGSGQFERVEMPTIDRGVDFGQRAEGNGRPVSGQAGVRNSVGWAQ